MGGPILNHDQTVAIYVILALILIFGLSFWRRRQNAIHNLRKLLAAVIGGLLMYFIFRLKPDLAPAALYVGAITTGLLWGLRPGRKREMKADVKRRVIAKWTIATGKKYNPRLHEIDHIIPFAKGGSDTEDNLRVIEKKKNRSKGARSPWWDTMSR